MSKVLAVIPARSGSKGLKNKNILPLGGKPLIGHTIEAAIQSGLFEDVFVSTDSGEYKEISEKYGAWVPFLRSGELAGDRTATNDVLTAVLSQLTQLGKTYDSFVLLQPTSPLRNEHHIRQAFQLFTEKKANAVVSVTEAEHALQWYNTIKSDLCMDGFLNSVKTRRQEMDAYYRINGAIYILKTDYFLKYKNYYESECYAYIMDKMSSVDIDDGFDFKFAQFLLCEKEGITRD